MDLTVREKNWKYPSAHFLPVLVAVCRLNKQREKKNLVHNNFLSSMLFIINSIRYNLVFLWCCYKSVECVLTENTNRFILNKMLLLLWIRNWMLIFIYESLGYFLLPIFSKKYEKRFFSYEIIFICILINPIDIPVSIH